MNFGPPGKPLAHRRPNGLLVARGFTLMEMLLVVAIIGILMGVALPAYEDYLYRARIAQAKSDIREMEMAISQYEVVNRAMPDTLAQVGHDGRTDPWGMPYRYLNLTIPKNLKSARKDRNLHPLNSDFDLYSIGRDHKSALPLTAKPSHDDIIRANNGRFLGLGAEY